MNQAQPAERKAGMVLDLYHGAWQGKLHTQGVPTPLLFSRLSSLGLAQCIFSLYQNAGATDSPPAPASLHPSCCPATSHSISVCPPNQAPPPRPSASSPVNDLLNCHARRDSLLLPRNKYSSCQKRPYRSRRKDHGYAQTTIPPPYPLRNAAQTVSHPFLFFFWKLLTHPRHGSIEMVQIEIRSLHDYTLNYRTRYTLFALVGPRAQTVYIHRQHTGGSKHRAVPVICP